MSDRDGVTSSPESQLPRPGGTRWPRVRSKRKIWTKKRDEKSGETEESCSKTHFAAYKMRPRKQYYKMAREKKLPQNPTEWRASSLFCRKRPRPRVPINLRKWDLQWPTKCWHLHLQNVSLCPVLSPLAAVTTVLLLIFLPTPWRMLENQRELLPFLQNTLLKWLRNALHFYKMSNMDVLQHAVLNTCSTKIITTWGL